MLRKVETDKKLHVLVSIPTGRESMGGIDRIMKTLSDALRHESPPGLTTDFRPSRGPGSLWLSPFYILGFGARMIWLRLTGRLDVVHLNLSSHGSTYRKMLFCWLARLLGVPYVLHLHGGGYPDFWKPDNSWLSRAILSMFEHAAAIIVLGTVWRRFVEQRAPRTADRIIVVPNAAPTPSLPTNRGDDVHILFLGRVSPQKGAPELIEALCGMAGLPGWRATLAGSGDLDAARQRAEDCGMADRLAVPGWVDGDSVAQLIASADILVLPSHIENLPISIIEGMAAGLAVVATPVGAVEDIVIEGKTGLLVPPGDVAALTAALQKLVTNEELRHCLGTAAQAMHREKLDVCSFSEAIINVWRTAPSVKGK